MAFIVTAAVKSGSQGQVLHYSLYAVLVLVGGVLLWVAQQFFGGIITGLGSQSADSIVAGFARRGRIAGGRLRKYRRAIQRNYAAHALGFGGTEVIDIRAVYVPLRDKEAGRREDIYAQIRDERRSVVVGPAGAGKSLLLKNSMLIWADDSHLRPWHRGDRRVPVLVELHRCNDSDADIAQLVLDELDRNQVRRPKTFVARALRDGRLRLLLDGLDEVGKDSQERVLTMIRDFARGNPDCQVVVTCRDAVYYGQLSPEFQHVVRIADFDDASIRRLLGNWPGIERPDVDSLVGALRADPQLMHLARSPLLLTMIAYLYVNRFAKSGRSLPSSRVTFYETAITHLLGRDQALVRAASLSTYDVGDKLAALQRVAVTMQRSAAGGQSDRKEIAAIAAIAATRSVLPDLNLDDNNAKPLFQEIVDRSQLLISLDQQRSHYSFRHLTLQEFLAARELADRPDDLLSGYRNDPDSWREVVKLWCGVTTRNSTTVIREVLAFGSLRQQVVALECLAEAKYVDEAFARQVIDHFAAMLGLAGEAGQVLVAGFGALAAADGPRGRNVLLRLIDLANHAGAAGSEGTKGAAFAALSATGRREAAETLARLALQDENARVALRAMGELAIPVLEQQAAAGDSRAVDDLAFIGTPAAAESIACLLTVDGAASPVPEEIQAAAAWRLAELLTVPDVEEGLKNSRFRIPDGVPSYDWVWKPFALPGAQDGPIGSIIGRAAFLIDHNSGFMPTGDRSIDERIAIPLVGIEVGRCVNILTVTRLSEQVGISKMQAESQFLVDSHSQLTPSQPSAELAGKIIGALGMHPAHEYLMRHLAWPVLARLISGLFADRIRTTDSRDWLGIRQNPKPARLLWGVFWALLVALLGGASIFGSFWQVEVLRGVSHLSPSWLYTVTLFFVVVSWASFLGSFFVGAVREPISDAIAFIFIGGIIAVAAGFVVDGGVSGLVLSTWDGPVVAAPLAAAVGVTAFISWLAARRQRRYGNPLRRCFLASSRTFADRTSVIAG